MVHFSRSIEQRKQIYNSLDVVWCGVAIMNRQIVYIFTDVCQQIAYMVKQLNYVWLTAEITVYNYKIH